MKSFIRCLICCLNCCLNCCLVLLISISSLCFAQDQPPPVDEIFKTFDANEDGFLTTTEVSENAGLAKQFVRWDSNNDGKVSGNEIVEMRAKFGIATDGSRIPAGGNSQAEGNPPKPTPLFIPDVADLVRVDRDHRPPRKQPKQSAFLMKTSPHAVTGEAYVILTDHSDESYLAPLRKLAKHHGGELFSVKDLRELADNDTSLADLRKKLDQAKVKYVAIAPRLESFRENMVLSMWELLSTLDDDPQLDCFPGFLVASNATAFSRLIDQSIDHQPITTAQIKPFAINQVQNATETRSLQKSAILRKHFKQANIETPIVAIYGKTASSAPRLEGEHTWNLTVESRRQFVKEFPVQATQELAEANLVVMHGHGIPGMSCSMDVDAIPGDFQGKVLLSGSCFSACPVKSDLAAMREAPGGYQVQPRDAFILRAIDNGAVVAFGHQRLSRGFPALYPVLESWTQGESVGQGYQQLINSLIESNRTKSGGFIISEQDRQKKRVRQNSFLYVVIGDPAMTPFEAQPLLK